MQLGINLKLYNKVLTIKPLKLKPKQLMINVILNMRKINKNNQF